MATSEPTLRHQLPHGLTDLFGEQAAAKTTLEDVLQATFRRWSYTRIIPPTFEYFDSIATGASPQLLDEMYRFFDREGRMLALRTDMTVPTARVVGAKLYDQPLPLRFYYIGNVFRHEEPQAGRRREFTQAGTELIGAGTPEADAEVLAVVVDALQAMGVAEFQINLGQVAYLKGILAGGRLDNGELYRIEQAISRKNDVELAQVLTALGITGDAGRAVRAIPHLCGGEEVLDEAECLAVNAAALEAIAWLRRVYALAQAEGIAEHIILDLSEVRSMAYYTGITFHTYVAGLGFHICSGGRYDGLIANFGADLPAVGFALGVERIMLVTRPQVEIAPQVLIQTNDRADGYGLAALARRRGLRVEIEALGRRGSDLLTYARERSAKYLVVCEGAGYYTLSDGAAHRIVTRAEIEKEIAAWAL